MDWSRRHQHQQRSKTPEHRRRKRDRERDEYDEKKVVADFVDGIAKEQQQQKKKKKRKTSENDNNGGSGGEGEGVEGDGEDDEIEMMKKLGIPTGFDSTKGKPVLGADVSGVRPVTKRQPRQYMNRRGGFNRPLPAERNR